MSDKPYSEIFPPNDGTWTTKLQREELEVIASRFYDALYKISCKPAIDKDYESAYWDIVLEADAALYPDEYERKDDEDGRKELDETSKDS